MRKLALWAVRILAAVLATWLLFSILVAIAASIIGFGVDFFHPVDKSRDPVAYQSCGAAFEGVELAPHNLRAHAEHGYPVPGIPCAWPRQRIDHRCWYLRTGELMDQGCPE